MVRVAINGLGRIGRAALKIIMETPELELAAVNDLTPVDNLVYLLRYDSVYGRYEKKIETSGDGFTVDGKMIRAFSEKDPSRLPWKSMNIDLVFECTGHFATKEGMLKHIDAGAQRVILSAPAKGEDIPTVLYAVNDIPRGATLISTASCTTNSLGPVMEVVGRRIGIRKAIMTTVHAYTSTQSLVDGPNKKIRRGRAAAVNFVPAATGAAVATTKALPQFAGKFDGSAVRAPVPVGSVSDIVMVTSRPTSIDEVKQIFTEEASSDRYRNVLAVTNDEIVSSDIIMDAHAATVDLTTVKVVDGDLLKVMSWYDNEWGYSHQMVRTAVQLTRELASAAAGT